MATCKHCGKPLPRQQGPGRPRRFCDDICRLAAWRGTAPVKVETISGPDPFPCPTCDQMTTTITKHIYNRRIVHLLWSCPCGQADSLTRTYDPDHDLLPYPRPILTIALPVRDADYWRQRALEAEAKLKAVER